MHGLEDGIVPMPNDTAGKDTTLKRDVETVRTAFDTIADRLDTFGKARAAFERIAEMAWKYEELCK